MRQFPVPALFDERPREVGGIVTLKQAGYLAGGLTVGLAFMAFSPRWLAMPVMALSLLGGASLAFGHMRGVPADRVLLLWLLFRIRPSRACWQADAEMGPTAVERGAAI